MAEETVISEDTIAGDLDWEQYGFTEVHSKPNALYWIEAYRVDSQTTVTAQVLQDIRSSNIFRRGMVVYKLRETVLFYYMSDAYPLLEP